MAGHAINAEHEALELRELSSEELDAVSDGRSKDKEQDNRKQLEALETFRKALQSL